MSKVVTIQLKADTKGAEKNVENLNKDLKETQGDLSGVEAAADKATGGMVSGFKGATTGIKSVVKGFKSMRMAIIATGIGALVLAISSVAAAFTSTEEGQNKFNKLMTVLGSITGNLIDVLASLGNAIINVFTNPVDAIKKFTNLIKENIVNRFEGLLELIPQLGKAVSLLFKGEFSEAGKVAVNATAKVVLGVENVVEKTQQAIEKTQEFVQELVEEGKIAAQIADQRAKADKLERNLLVERAKANRDRAELLEKAVNKEQFATSQRIQFLKDAGALEDEITQKEIKAAQLRLDAKVAENALAGSTKEDLNEEAQLRANLINLETAKLTKQKEVTSQIIALNNEEKAALKAIEDEKKANQKEADARRDADLKANADYLAKKKAQEDLAEQEQLTRDEQQWNMLQKLRNTAQEQELLELQQQFDLKMELAYGNNELELALQEEFNAQATAIDGKYIAINKAAGDKARADNLAAEQQMQDLKRSAVQTGLTSISQLTKTFAGESEKEQKKAFEINKAVSIASTLIQTYQAAQGAYLSQLSIPTPDAPIRAAVAAGIATATGLVNVATIAKQKFKGSGGGAPAPSGGGGVGGGGTSPSQAPSFNVVGQSGFNQVAGALGSQPPIQAFVVAGAVTNAQQLQNNTINQATF
jgi:hypothetical protein